MKETLEIELRTKEAREAAKKLSRELDRLEKEGNQTSRSMDKTAAAVKKSGRAMSTYVGSLIGGVGLYGAVTKTLSATIKQEAALASIESRLGSTGNAVGKTAAEIAALASSMQGFTVYGDEEIMEMQELLLTFTNITGDAFDATSIAVANVATVMKTDLRSAALQLGKAMHDPVLGVTALSRAGVIFTGEQREMIKVLVETGDVAGAQTIILKELETQFGDAARAARDTLGGSIAALKNTIGDLLEGDSGSTQELKHEIQELEKLVGSQGMQDAFASMTAGILSTVGAAASGIKIFADLGESIGNAAGKVAVSFRIEELTEDIEDIEDKIASLNRTKKISVPHGDKWLAAWSGLPKLKKELAQLKAIRDALATGRDSGAFAGTSPVELYGPPSPEEFRKMGEDAAKKFYAGFASAASGGGGASVALRDALAGVDTSGLDAIKEQYTQLAAVIDSQDPNFAIINRINELYALAQAFPEYSDIITDEIFDLQEGMDAGAEATENMTSAFSDMMATEVAAGIRQMSDAMVDFALTGEQSFADMTQSILANLAKMILQQQIFNALSGTSFGSFLGVDAPGTTAAPSPIIASATAPIRGATSSAATGEAVTVNVINNSSGTSMTQREVSTSGGKSIEVIVSDIVDANLLSGRHNRAMGVAFGMKRVPA